LAAETRSLVSKEDRRTEEEPYGDGDEGHQGEE
jgi:hypothetical protein